MEGKHTIGMLRQYYYQVISKSELVIQVCGPTLFNQIYISLHELYLELPQAPSSTSCIAIHKDASPLLVYKTYLSSISDHNYFYFPIIFFIRILNEFNHRDSISFYHGLISRILSILLTLRDW